MDKDKDINIESLINDDLSHLKPLFDELDKKISVPDSVSPAALRAKLDDLDDSPVPDPVEVKERKVIRISKISSLAAAFAFVLLCSAFFIYFKLGNSLPVLDKASAFNHSESSSAATAADTAENDYSNEAKTNADSSALMTAPKTEEFALTQNGAPSEGASETVTGSGINSLQNNTASSDLTENGFGELYDKLSAISVNLNDEYDDLGLTNPNTTGASPVAESDLLTTISGCNYYAPYDSDKVIISDATTSNKIGSIDVSGYHLKEIFSNSNNLIFIADNSYNVTSVIFYNLKNKTSPSLSAIYNQDGSYIHSFLINDFIYVVTENDVANRILDLKNITTDIIPEFSYICDNITNRFNSVPENTAVMEYGSVPIFTIVQGIDIMNAGTAPSSFAVLGKADDITIKNKNTLVLLSAKNNYCDEVDLLLDKSRIMLLSNKTYKAMTKD